MNDHLPKPFEPPQLYEMLLRWLPDGDPVAPPRNAPPPEQAPAGPRALPNAPGIDTRQGIRNVGGRVEVYVRLLATFAERHKEDVERLREQLDVGDRETARRTAHSLKGSAGSLGLSMLHGACAKLEQAIAASEGMETLAGLIASAEEHLDAVCTAIDAARPAAGDETPADGETAPEAVPAILDELETLLASDDPRASAHLQAHAAQFRSSLGGRFATLRSQIDEFDFVAALATLRAARTPGKPTEDC